jgi:hypothetical protein
MLRNFGVSERLKASHEGPNSMEMVLVMTDIKRKSTSSVANILAGSSGKQDGNTVRKVIREKKD